MNKKEVDILIAAGEGLNLDLKRSMSSSHSNTLVAFANAEGGRILLGVEDDGTITGHTLTNQNRSQIEDIARGCDPPVDIEIEDVQMSKGLSVTVIHVPPSEQVPHRSTNGFYLRQGASSVKMRTNDIRAYSVYDKMHKNC
jgi:ATP-dependent DNA helicase RecG